MENFNIDKNAMISTKTPYFLSSYSVYNMGFYETLDSFGTQVIHQGQMRFGDIIQKFQSSGVYLRSEFDLKPDECLLDLLIAGILWNQYKGCWGKSIELKAKILNQLYVLRQNNPQLKPFVDKVRGKLSYSLLNNSSIPDISISLSNLEKLCVWLSATNEFNEEVKRIEIWMLFMATLPEKKYVELLNNILDFASWFKIEAKKNLGIFTKGVDAFLAKHTENYKGKEDYFFTGRSEVEYHLNMAGAAIMNRCMKDDFLAADHKVLLLPSCMAKNNNCKAYEVMHGYVCAHCTKGCSILEASSRMKENGGHTFIVHHSSGFSKSLKRWANKKNVGLIGTACTLNLLTGGYEMKRLNIPAQCIFLNYSGCKKHWASVNIPTSIDLHQLQNIVGVAVKAAV